MTIKITQLPNITSASLNSTTSIIPVVANIGPTVTTYRTTMANVKSYVENGNFAVTGTISSAGSATFSDNVTILGGLVVSGNVTYSGSNNLVISDNVIELHVANAANVSEPWTVDDGKDIGIRFHYFSTQNDDAAFVFSHDEKDFEFYDSGVLGTNVFVGNSYGKIRAGQAIFVNATPTTGNGTGTLQSHGGAAITGNLYVGGLSTLTGNITSSGNLALTGTATVGGQILATGNIVTDSRMSTGNLNVNTFATIGTTLVTAGNTTVNGLTVNTSASITGNLDVTGNINGSNIVLTTNGNITNISAANIKANYIGNLGSKFFANVTTHNGEHNVLFHDCAVNYGAAHELLMDQNVAFTYNPGTGTLTANNFSGLASSAQYADLAEKYVPDQYYDPGTVVIFGGEKEITVTDQQGDTRVAGAISTQPAYLMNKDQENGVALALRGKVPVKIVGSVNKGDLLITSNNAGYATAAKFYAPDPNAVFAKSLERDDNDGPRVIWAVIL